MIKRILFGALTIGLIAAVAYLDKEIFPAYAAWIVISFLGLLAQHEFYRMARSAGSEAKPVAGLIAGAALFAVLPLQGAELAIVALCAGLLLLFCFELSENEIRIERLFVTFFPLVFLCVPLALLAFVRFEERLGGFEGMIFLLVVAKIGDILAYFGGTFFGKNRMAPRISPNKTWEGAVIGFLGAAGVSLLLVENGWLAGVSLGGSLALGAGINVGAQLGDLSESYVKRFWDVKDSARYFSVLGGAMDMIDSFIFAAPVYVGLRHFL